MQINVYLHQETQVQMVSHFTAKFKILFWKLSPHVIVSAKVMLGLSQIKPNPQWNLIGAFIIIFFLS